MTMRRPIEQTLVFVAACVSTVLLWNRLAPKPVLALSDENKLAPEVRSPEPVEVDVLIRQLKESEDSPARLKVALRFNEIPVPQVQEALGRVLLIEDRKLTFPAKLLLMRWAGENGEDAVAWAWKRFRAEGVWNDAFKEITAAWAWRKPESLVDWAKRMAGIRNIGHGTISLADANLSEHPILDFDDLNKIAWNLVHVSPRHGFEVLKLRGGMSTDDKRFYDSLPTLAAVQEALMAFDHLDQLQPDHFEGLDQINAISLMHRWKKLDPKDFARSHYAHLIPDRHVLAPTVPAGLPSEPVGWISEFSIWSSFHPGEAPDMTGWSVEKIEAWKDHEALFGNAAMRE